MKLLIISTLFLSVSANAAATMTLFQPAFNAAAESSSEKSKKQPIQKDTKTPIICYSESLTRYDLPILITKKTAELKMSIPSENEYKVFKLVPNDLSVEATVYSYVANGNIQYSLNNKDYDKGEFRINAVLAGRGTLTLMFDHSKKEVELPIICSSINR